jgi:hypothetical protein
MLLNIFKINNHLASVYLLLFTLVLGIFAINLSVDADVFANSVLSFFIHTKDFGILSQIGGILLLLSNVLVFDLFMSSQEISEKSNRVPAFLLGIFLCYPLSQNPLHPLLFAQLLLSASMWYFISIYKLDKTFSPVFNGAFCISTATLFYPPFIVFIPMCFICLLILRSFVLREWILAFIGIILPYFFYISLLFLFDKNMQQPALNLADSFHAPSIPAYIKGSFLINLSVALMTVFALIFFLIKTVSNIIKTQKAFIVFLWVSLFSIPVWFIVSTGGAFSALLSAMPISVFCGIYLGNTKRRILAELLLWSLLSAFVISLFQQSGII